MRFYLLTSYLSNLEPRLTPLQQKAVNSRGGWGKFMASFGLKPAIRKDVLEAQEIATALANRNGADEDSDD